MKKYIFSTLCGLILISFLATAQKVVKAAEEVTGTTNATFNRKGAITEDKTETLEITGMGASTFSTSNTYDGTTKSYKHDLRITVDLLTLGTKIANFQLVFYSMDEQMPFAANSNAGITYVYYPISFYDGIKLKLDQSLAAKKKILLKVTLRKDGFREGILIL